MPDATSPIDVSEIRRRALSRWDTDGGATAPIPSDAHHKAAPISNTELVLLRVRVIALENLMIAVLSEGSERQREMAREMAGYIAPQPDNTQHPLTVQAARHMTNLVDRALHFCLQER